MAELEDRLLHCLEVNLNHKDEVISGNSWFAGHMRMSSFHLHLADTLATALNIYRKNYFVDENYNFVTPADVVPYTPLHTKEAIDRYELKYGIRTFMFAIHVPNMNWRRLLKKLDIPGWAGGIYLPAGRFNGFYQAPWHFSSFGLEIMQDKSCLEHEALHCDRRVYSANCNEISGFDANPDYKNEKLITKVQMSFVDEMLCYIHDGKSQISLKKLLKGKYWGREIDFIVSRFKGLNQEDKRKKSKEIEKKINPVKLAIPDAVRAAHALKYMLPPDILTPLFYSLGPTIEEIKAKQFRPPFEDIKLWADALGNGRIKPETVLEQLQKRGYCTRGRITVIPPEPASAAPLIYARYE
ncbi:MAG: hypothetical protein KJ955_00015 [Nanoarchaeota archaeon]|nr:hypothetical protein [Nanoarchaeota archaeon]